MDLRMRVIAAVGTAMLIATVALGGAPGLVAQDATPVGETPTAAGRPAHIHAGSCDTLGNVLQPLNDLTAPTGTTEGLATAIVAETSFTEAVPMSLDQILADDHAINVHLSEAEIGDYIACGDIGGVRNAQGAVVIGLSELNDSGFTGIAFLSPNATDPATTDVSTFIAEGLAAGASPGALATPGAAANTVDVTLTEFAIDMPTSISAGEVTFVVTNNGAIEHNFEVEGEGIEEEFAENLQPGETNELTLDLEPGTYEVYCPVGNHEDEGMSLELTVTG